MHKPLKIKLVYGKQPNFPRFLLKVVVVCTAAAVVQST